MEKLLKNPMMFVPFNADPRIVCLSSSFFKVHLMMESNVWDNNSH